MAAQDLHEKPFSEETITKLDIFEKYLESWLPVAIQSRNIHRINICDFFAGPGKDIIGTEGSPLRIIRIIKKFEKLIIEQKLIINILLNEYIPSKHKQLCNCIDEEKKYLKQLSDLVKIEIYKQDFKKLFDMKKSSIVNHFSLLFLDQSGIKQITENVFAEIILFPKTDFMFFVSSSFFKRFDNTYGFYKYFPDINHEEISQSKQTEMHRVIYDYYKDKIPNNCKTKLYPFTLKKGPNIFGLIFGSKHPLGIEKFLKIAWKKNELNGEANFDIDEDWQASQFTLFGPRKMTKIEKFQSDLEKLIIDKEKISNKEIYYYTLEAGHMIEHAIPVLIKLRSEKKVCFSGHPNISYNKCYKSKEIKYFKVIEHE